MSGDPEDVERARASTRRIVKVLLTGLGAVVVMLIVAWLLLAVLVGWFAFKFD